MTDDTETCFTVTAEADPQTLLRVLGLFAQRYVTPTSVESRQSGTQLEIVIKLPDLAADAAAIIAGKLRSSVMVYDVACS